MKSIFFYIVLIFSCTAHGAQLRAGLLQSPQRHEYGLNLNLEYVGGKHPDLYDIAFHIGSNINLDGYTSVLYIGTVWEKVLKNRIFVELSLGGALHNGSLSKKTKNKNRKKIGRIFGSRLLFRESIDLGYIFKNEDKISLFMDHISNANIAPPNHGLTNLGVRYSINL
jgi:hypothetical protein